MEKKCYMVLMLEADISSMAFLKYLQFVLIEVPVPQDFKISRLGSVEVSL